MAWAVWVTGLPGSGKTVISKRVKEILSEEKIDVKMLRLDEIRRIITPNPSYSDEERDIIYASLAYMAMLLVEEGKNVIIDATAHKRKYRDLARRLIPNFVEVYVRCPLDVCMKREEIRVDEYTPSNIYKRSVEEDATVPGVNVDYEGSEPEVVIDSNLLSIDDCSKEVVKRVHEDFE
jgi:adenylylsulfate kinase